MQRDAFPNMPGRLHGYLLHEDYWGQPGMIGFFAGVSTHANPNAEVAQ
jgi:hypothetical protein